MEEKEKKGRKEGKKGRSFCNCDRVLIVVGTSSCFKGVGGVPKV
jgi:hypothetical protein